MGLRLRLGRAKPGDRADPAQVQLPEQQPAAPAVPASATLAEAESDLASFVVARYPRLIALAGLICLDLAIAEGIVQTALRRAWQARGRRTRVERSARALDQAVVRASLRTRRSASRSGGGLLGRLVAAPSVVALGEGSGHGSAGSERGRSAGEGLGSAFDALAATQRAVLALHLPGDYSIEETAALLGERPGRVRASLRAARNQLRRALDGPTTPGPIPDDQLDLTIVRFLTERADELRRYALPLRPTMQLVATPSGTAIVRTTTAGALPAAAVGARRQPLRRRTWAAGGAAALVLALVAGYLLVGPPRATVGGYLRTARAAAGFAWSPDGSRLAFLVDVSTPLGIYRDATPADLYVVDGDGGGLQRLRSAIPFEFEPRWSPSGRELAIPARLDGADRIEILDVDTGAARILPAPEGSAFDPRWSPDGRQILFSTGKDWSNEEGWKIADVWVVDADGGSLRNLSSRGTASGGQWSPDGRWVLYTTNTMTGGSLMVVRADGGGTRRLGDCCDGVWSEDSARVRVSEWHDTGVAVALLPVEDGPATILGTFTDYPSWSPDGTRYASTTNALNPPGGGEGRLAIVSSEGSLIWVDAADAIMDEGPSWSPDGSTVIFTSQRPEGSGLYVLDLALLALVGGTPRLILPNVQPWSATSAAWRPEAEGRSQRELALDRDGDVYLLRADGSGMRQLARAPSPDATPGAAYLPGENARVGSLPTSMSIDGHGPTAVVYEMRGDKFWVVNGSASPWVIEAPYAGGLACSAAAGATEVPNSGDEPGCIVAPGGTVSLSADSLVAGVGGATMLELEPGFQSDDRRKLDVYLHLPGPDS